MRLLKTKADDLVYLAPLLCFGFAWLVGHFDWFQRFEWRTLDWRTQVRAEMGQSSPDERIQVIGIGDRSTTNIEPWPFRRSYHAQFQLLAAHEKPAVLVWDIIYQNRIDVNGTPLDAASDDDFSGTTRVLHEDGIPVVFAAVSGPDPTGDSLAQLGSTRAITRIEGDIGLLSGDPELTMPFPGLREYGYFGTVDAPRGAGGIVRRMPMLIRVGPKVFPSLSLQSAMQYWRIEVEDLKVVMGDAIYLGPKADGRTVPIDENGMMLINFRYETMTSDDPLGVEFTTLEYFDQLVALHQKYVVENPESRPPVSMQEKIVIVGEFSTDTGPSPRSDQSPLVLLHANVLNSILQNDFVSLANPPAVWSGALAWCYLSLILLRKRSIVILVLFTLLSSAGFVWLCFATWIDQSLWIPMSAPLLGFGMLQFAVITQRVISEQLAKAQVRAMFGSYVSPIVVNQMVAAETQPELGGIDEEITAYFSDIQSFSTFSEVLSTTQLVELLNEYLTACTDIIQEQGGTLDKYIGDAVVAIFGAPVKQTEHAFKACLTTQLVQKRLGELRQKWRSEGDKWPGLVHQMRTRIGLNTGVCMIGNMGSRTRFNYTMMGDNVNLAARMESGAKSWGVYTMVTDSTKSACESFGGDRLVFRALGKIQVQGRSRPVPIHEVVGLKEDLTEDIRTCLTVFAEGLDAFFARDWEKARELFERSARFEPNQPDLTRGIKTNPSLIYLKRAEAMKIVPPAENWDGVFRMTEK